MKSKFKELVVLGSLVLVFGLLVYSCIRIYKAVENIEVSGTVLEKYGQDKSRYKSTKIYTPFILIVKTDRYGVKDFTVSPSTYYLHNPGSKITLTKVSPLNLDSHRLSDYKWFTLMAIILAFLWFSIFFLGIKWISTSK